MTMKKVLALALSMILSLSALVACGNGNEGGGSEAAADDAAPAAQTDDASAPYETADNSDIVEIIWQYPSTGNLGSGFQEVEDALNEMLERDIGTRVRLEPVGLMDAQNEAVLMVSSGEQLDICLTAFSSIGPIVDRGLIIPLDDLLDQYGAAIKDHCGALLLGCSYNGEIYGVPPAFTASEFYGYAIRVDLAEKYDIEIDADKFYTLQDIEEIFATVKAGEGEGFYCTIPWNTENPPLNNSYIEYDRVTGSLSGGVLMLNRSFEDNTITNLFATEEYEQYVYMMYDWAQKGYISPDAAVTTESPETVLSGGNHLGMFYWADVGSADNINAGGVYEMATLKMLDGYVPNNGGGAIQWGIPITSANPEKAMETLNYIYQNPEAAWLLQFGLEGESYEVVEETEYGDVIQYLSDDPATLPYFQPYGIYGNRLQWPAVYPAAADMNARFIAEEEAIPQSRYSPALGYAFVQESVSAEIAAVNTVIDQYTPSFNSGALNPDTALPEFIAALEAAGIDKIIAENQRQYDEWLAAQ